MGADAIAANLLRLRSAAELSQDKLAESAGLSRVAYRNIERGESIPRAATLLALARALDVPLQELVAPAVTLRRVRFRSLKRMKRRAEVLARVGRWLQDFTALETLLGERPLDSLSELRRVAQAARAQGVPAVAEAARQAIGLSPREPVHDICGLLESRGIKVGRVEVASDAFSGLSVSEDDGGPAVIVNTWERLPVEHQILSAAHELGHLLLHLGAYDVGVEEEDEGQETEAEAFAAHFLMPDAVFQREWRAAAGLPFLDRVLKVKRVFRVSWRTVVFRVAEAQPPERRGRIWMQLQVEHQRRYGRALLKLDEPKGVDPSVFRAPTAEPAELDAHDFQSERLARLVRRAVEEEAITLSRAAEILGVSLQEMRERAASWIE